MTDLEMTKLCAEAMEYKIVTVGRTIPRPDVPALICLNEYGREFNFNPLHDDAQAMALVKKFHIELEWDVEWFAGKASWSEKHIDLNRAVVECVAKMQKAKHAAA